MLIYICCAGGMTSSLFCQKIAKAANPDNVYFNSLKKIVENYESLTDHYETLIGYGSEGTIKNYNLDSIFKPYVDLVLVCPQVRYKTASIRKLLTPINIPCYDIDMTLFGTMNGEKALAQILNYQKEIEKN